MVSSLGNQKLFYRAIAWANRYPYLFLFIPSLLQLSVTATFGLGVDEAHYMLYGRYLDWSYFDHPPLVGWVHAAFNFILGENEFSARLPAVLFGYGSALGIFAVLRARLPRASALGITFVTTTLVQIFILNLFLLPDTFLLTFSSLIILVCDNILRTKRFDDRAAAQLGCLLALSALAKLSAVLFVPPLLIFLLSQFGGGIFLRRPIWILALIAFLGTLPILWWNSAHDWISFRYQAGHVLAGSDHLRSFLQSWILQLAMITPWFWAVSAAGFLILLRGKSETFIRWLLISFLIFFGYASFASPVLPHWTAVFYLWAFPFGAAYVLDRFKKWFFGFALFQMGLLVLVVMLFTTGLIRFVPGALREIEGWPDIMSEAATELKSRSGGAIGVFNWTYGSRAMFYGGRTGINARRDIYVLDDHADQFHIWNPASPVGEDVLIISFSYDRLDPSRFNCSRGWGDDHEIPISRGSTPLYTAFLTWCRGWSQR